MGISIRTSERWSNNLVDGRNGPTSKPANKLTEAEREKVISISTSNEFKDLPPCQIVPKLADQGKYLASESTFYRIFKMENLLAHRGKSKPKKHQKPDPLVATGPNQIWSWDITFLRTMIRGDFFYLYMFMDIFSRKIVGYEIFEEESMENSSLLMRKICKDEEIEPGQLVLHADNGGAMKGSTMLAMLYGLGVVPSFSRPRVSDDNPFSESLFKTLKYCPTYPTEGFESIQAARTWTMKFVHWYNEIHLHSGIKFISPSDKHRNVDIEILKKRKELYENAKTLFPNRWSGKTRNWEPVKKVYLNQRRKHDESIVIPA